jgi:hypothetical protein
MFTVPTERKSIGFFTLGKLQHLQEKSEDNSYVHRLGRQISQTVLSFVTCSIAIDN